MAISGLVVTLADDKAAADAAVKLLGADKRLTIGERFGRRLALVADTPTVNADRVLWDELRETPGVAYVDVTFVHLDADPVPGKEQNQVILMEDGRANH